MQLNKIIYDIVILTDSRYIRPTKTNWYINQVLEEDSLLQIELEKRNLKVCKKDWADSSFEWETTKYAIFRTTWDYFDKYNKFIIWLNETKKKTHFINSAEIIKWNIDKHYLKDLNEKGINIAKTIFVEKGQQTNLKQLFKEIGCNEAVIKPAISGAAKNTFRICSNQSNKYEKIFQKLNSNECILFQEFLKNITSKGELSLIMIDGKYTHAVKKTAKENDFRVQDDYGGKVTKYLPSKKEIKFAESCINAISEKTYYARVDIVYDNNEKISLSELELIEPELWFRKNTEAAVLLAKKIAKKVKQ